MKYNPCLALAKGFAIDIFTLEVVRIFFKLALKDELEPCLALAKGLLLPCSLEVGCYYSYFIVGRVAPQDRIYPCLGLAKVFINDMITHKLVCHCSPCLAGAQWLAVRT